MTIAMLLQNMTDSINGTFQGTPEYRTGPQEEEEDGVACLRCERR